MTLRYLVAEEAAEITRCCVRTIHERARKNEIPHRKFGRRLLFLEDELAAWLDGAPLEVTPLPGGGRCVRPRTRS